MIYLLVKTRTNEITKYVRNYVVYSFIPFLQNSCSATLNAVCRALNTRHPMWHYQDSVPSSLYMKENRLCSNVRVLQREQQELFSKIHIESFIKTNKNIQSLDSKGEIGSARGKNYKYLEIFSASNVVTLANVCVEILVPAEICINANKIIPVCGSYSWHYCDLL